MNNELTNLIALSFCMYFSENFVVNMFDCYLRRTISVFEICLVKIPVSVPRKFCRYINYRQLVKQNKISNIKLL